MPFTRLRYHIVTATYDRTPIITPEIEDVLYPALRTNVENVDGHVFGVGGVADHVHVVAGIPRTTSVADFLKVLKTGGSFAVRQSFGQHAFRWQSGYAAFTVDPHRMDRLLRYVARQKQHHGEGTTWPLYERLPRT